MSDRIHVFIGTKAQYIKTAPVVRLLSERGVDYRLIDSGQHAAIAREMRRELHVKEPDYVFGGDRDVSTIRDAVVWSLGIAKRLWSKRRLRNDVFGGDGGICVVHGDTPSTLLSAVLAWRAGLKVAHLEAGLRSNNLLHPFPEELIRIVVMRFAQILFAPTQDAVDNLERMRTRGRIVSVGGNTSIEAVAFARSMGSEADGPVVVTMHRVENLRSSERVEGFVSLVEHIAQTYAVRFVVHGPTREVLAKTPRWSRLVAAGVEIVDLVPHSQFIEMIAGAPFVVIDGGSIQEECAYLGVPTLIWREATERLHGLGENVVLAHHDPELSRRFVAEHEAYRRPVAIPDSRPSEQIVEELLDALG